MNGTATTGFTANTPKNLLLDAGAVYKNYGEETEAIIGATSGGNTFTVKPDTRQIAVDGIKSKSAKGLIVIDSVDITLEANFIEMTPDILAAALVATQTSVPADTTAGTPAYTQIKGKTQIEDADYIDNVALVAKLSGSQQPVIIIVKNAISLGGLEIQAQDSKDNVLKVTFTACADPSTPTELPYEIRYPSTVA